MTENKPALLIDTDPELFQKALFTDEAKTRMEILSKSMGDILLCEILRYGFFNKEEMVSDLSDLYRQIALPNLEEELRFNI